MSDETINGLVETIHALERDLEKYRWVPCSERLPSEDGYYLIALPTEHGTLYLPAHWYRGRWLNVNEHEDAFWMPIPAYEETDHE